MIRFGLLRYNELSRYMKSPLSPSIPMLFYAGLFEDIGQRARRKAKQPFITSHHLVGRRNGLRSYEDSVVWEW